MDLKKITLLILTYNEAPNIGRVLDRLSWAKRIVVVDSFSTDRTLEILKQHPQVQVFQRAFDHFSDQCNFGLQQVSTDWVLSLDADYILGEGFHDELKGIAEKTACVGYRASFKYCIDGYPLRNTLLPSRIVLYQRSQAVYCQDGHAHRVSLRGEICSLRSVIFHDDRKPFRRWFRDQKKYAELESRKLRSVPFSTLNIQDKIRRMIFFAPLCIGIYCLTFRGLIFDGWRGLYYVFQRVLAECLLSRQLLRQMIAPKNN